MQDLSQRNVETVSLGQPQTTSQQETAAASQYSGIQSHSVGQPFAITGQPNQGFISNATGHSSHQNLGFPANAIGQPNI